MSSQQGVDELQALLDSDNAFARMRYRNQFSRRKKALMKKSHDFALTFPAAEVWTLVYHNNRFYGYNSAPKNPRWPPTRSTVVCTPVPPVHTIR